MVKIAPSILSADFSNLSKAIETCDLGGADQIHIDIMDGHFVPNLTFGPQIVKDIRKLTDLPFDVHLMIENPENYIPHFADAGADFITVHVEACSDPAEVIRLIKDNNVKSGITLRPGTSLDTIADYLTEVDLILVMSVDPGFGGQGFIPDMLERVVDVRRSIDGIKSNHIPEISVDGGVKLFNAKEIAEKGADILVAGSAIFKTDDPISTIKLFKQLNGGINE